MCSMLVKCVSCSLNHGNNQKSLDFKTELKLICLRCQQLIRDENLWHYYRPKTLSVPRGGCTVSKQEKALVNEKCQAIGLQWEILKGTENVHLYIPKKQKCCHTHILKPKCNTVTNAIIC